MSETSDIEVRGVPADAVEVLRARAARRGIPFSAYLRELIMADAVLPDPEEPQDPDGVMERLARDEPIDYSIDDLRGFAAEGRRGTGGQPQPDSGGQGG